MCSTKNAQFYVFSTYFRKNSVGKSKSNQIQRMCVFHFMLLCIVHRKYIKSVLCIQYVIFFISFSTTYSSYRQKKFKKGFYGGNFNIFASIYVLFFFYLLFISFSNVLFSLFNCSAFLLPICHFSGPKDHRFFHYILQLHGVLCFNMILHKLLSSFVVRYQKR